MSIRIKKILLCVILAILVIVCLYSKLRTDENTDKNVSLKQLLAAGIRAAELGGLEVMTVHRQNKFKIESKGQTKEGVNDPVTAADYRSHCAMYRSLTEAFPEITVISEERSQDCDKVAIEDIRNSAKNINDYNMNDKTVNTKDVTIWIDPLDATQEFTENLLQYVTTMVCVAVKGQPIIGIIYKPFEAEQNHSLFWTWTNHAVSKNLKNLPKAKDRLPILIVSRSHAGQVNNISKVAFGNDIKIISAAGAGYKFLEVAVDNATIYIHTTAIKKWDICAGTAILRALGGTVTQLYDQQPIYFGVDDSKVLTKGLLATMSNHALYSDKFLQEFQSNFH